MNVSVTSSRTTSVTTSERENGLLAPDSESPNLRTWSSGEPGTFETFRRIGTAPIVVAVLSPFVALTTGYVQKFLLAVVVLDIPLQIGTHFYYREDDAALGALGGLGISVTTIALSGLYLSWCIRALAQRGNEGRPALHFSVGLTSYLAIAALSTLLAQNVTLSLFELFLFFESYLVYVYVANTIRTRQEILFVVKFLLIGCLLESSLMVAARFMDMQAILGTVSLKFQIDPDAARAGLLRVGGTVGSPNTAAAYLGIVLVAAASVIFASVQRGLKWLAAGVLGLGGVALIYTYSRGGWVAFALAIIGLCWVARRRRRLALAAPIVTAAVFTLLSLPFYDLISDRLFGSDKGSAESRVPLMKLALRISKDNPLLGVGPNNFTAAMDRYLTPEFRRGFLYAVHNKYLLVLSETGIAGMLAYVAFLLGTLRNGWQTWKAGDRLLSPLALGFTAAIVGHMVQMSVELFRGRPVQQLLWLIAAVLFVMNRIHLRSSLLNPLSDIT
jgi:putative inorganic carbon (HCO3(-)) transporter